MFSQSATAEDYAHWGTPEDFDIQNQNITSWIVAIVDSIEDIPARRNDPDRFRVHLIVECYSRSEDNVHEASRMASRMYEGLRNSCFPVASPDNPSSELGTVELYEVSTVPVGKLKLQDDREVQLVTAEVSGLATGLV